MCKKGKDAPRRLTSRGAGEYNTLYNTGIYSVCTSYVYICMCGHDIF